MHTRTRHAAASTLALAGIAAAGLALPAGTLARRHHGNRDRLRYTASVKKATDPSEHNAVTITVRWTGFASRAEDVSTFELLRNPRGCPKTYNAASRRFGSPDGLVGQSGVHGNFHGSTTFDTGQGTGKRYFCAYLVLHNTNARNKTTTAHASAVANTSLH